MSLLEVRIATVLADLTEDAATKSTKVGKIGAMNFRLGNCTIQRIR